MLHQRKISMYLKLIMLRYNPEQNAFDETPLHQFINYNALEVIEYHSSFYTLNGLPACAILLSYRKKEEPKMPNPAKSQAFMTRVFMPQATQQESNAPASGLQTIAVAPPVNTAVVPPANHTGEIKGQSRRKYKRAEAPDLSPEDKALWNALRDWRAEEAKRKDKPAYHYFLNDQILLLVNARPKTLEELKRVSGLGNARIQDFGRDILHVIAQHPKRIPAASAPPLEDKKPEQPVVPAAPAEVKA